jgi:hypothetical protein
MKNLITAQDIGTIAGDIAATCDGLELESVIRQLEIVLKFARSRSLMNTKLDQRLHAAAADGVWNQKPEEDNE